MRTPSLETERLDYLGQNLVIGMEQAVRIHPSHKRDEFFGRVVVDTVSSPDLGTRSSFPLDSRSQIIFILSLLTGGMARPWRVSMTIRRIMQVCCAHRLLISGHGAGNLFVPAHEPVRRPYSM